MLRPGVYCGGITVSNNASVTFNPGVYILLGGGLDVSNNGSLTGQNVSFYNTFDGTHPFAPITPEQQCHRDAERDHERRLAGDPVL